MNNRDALIVPVPAGMSIDHVINYQLFAVADIHNIYIGVMTDGALELKAESTDATIIPPADCLVAKTIVSGEEFVQQPGTQWYQFPMSLIDEMGDAASISFKNMTSKHATLTTGVTISCEYAAATVAKVKVPRDIEFTLNMPKSLISKVRGLIDPAIANFYLQLTTDQAIAFTLNTQATGVRACASAVEFDWTAWEIDGLQLEANKEQWYKVNIAHPLEKLKNGEDITLALSNPNLMPVEVDLAVSPTCPVVLSLEKSVTVPAKTAVSKTISYDEVMKLLAQYDKYDLADRDFGKLMEQINVYVLYNKLTQLLTDRGYDKYLPLDKIDPVVNKYGEAASLANLKELVENYDKYLTVAELKSRLEPYKEKVSIETLLGLIDKYGDYIPYVDAQQLIDNADVLIPYIGTATVIVDKCKQYISKDDLKNLVERIKSYVPFEEMKKLVARLEKYLPEENVFYLYVKASGDLEINPGAPIEPDCTDEAIETTVEACDVYEWHGVEYTESGDYTYTENVANCEDAEWLDWKQPIKLSEFTAPWYKLDVSEIITNESDFSLTLVNDLGESVQMPLELHYYCSEDGDGFIASDSREIAEGTYTREIPYALFDEFIGPEYETIYLHNVKADCDRVEVLHLTIVKSEITTMPIEYATICEGETYDWRGNTYSVSDTIVVEEALECGKAIHTLKLDVINNDTVMPKEYMTICEGETYPWHGTDYTVSGTYTDVVALTCGTATYTLVLDVINGDTTITTEATICEGESYEWRGTDYTVAGTYTDAVALTCGTATYTLVLTVKDCGAPCVDETQEYYVTADCSYTWDVNGVTYDASGDYTHVTDKGDGCTLTEILHLTVNPCTPTPDDPCLNVEEVSWTDTVDIPETAGKWYKIDVRTAVESGQDVNLIVENADEANNIKIKFTPECFTIVPEKDTLIYELNGGLLGNDEGWLNKNDMFQACMAECGVTGLADLDDLKAAGVSSFNTIGAKLSNVSGMLSNPEWDWLEAYIMSVQNADPSASRLYEGSTSAAWRYAVAAFFLETKRASWPVSADFSYAGKDEAYLPAWGQSYPNPAKAVDGYVLSEPTKEGYTFAGWYTTPDFSGTAITTLSADTKGTLYAKWIEYTPTVAAVKAMGVGVETRAGGVVTYINGKNVYAQDATGGILFYMKEQPTFAVGDQIIVKGKTALYGGAPELTSTELVSAEAGELPMPIVLENLTEIFNDTQFKYFGTLVAVPGLKITGYDGYNNPTVTDGINSIKCYKMVLDPAEYPVGAKVDVVAVAAYYNGYQFQGDVAGISKTIVGVKDTYNYPTRHNKYHLENNWVVSKVTDNYAANKPGSTGYVRGMAAKDGIMYFINRETGSIVRVDGATGNMLEPIKITGEHLFEVENADGTWSSGVTLKFNDIKFDDAGNCLISGMITSVNQHFMVYEVDLATGAATLIVSEKLGDNPSYAGIACRFDAFGVNGDIHGNACIMAADATGTWNTYRWLIEDGVVGQGEMISIYLDPWFDESLAINAAGFGTAPQIFPQNEEGTLFYVDGFNTLPMLFDEGGMLVEDFIKCPYGTQVENNPGDNTTLSSALNGIREFKVGDEYFLLMAATHTVSTPPSAFALYKFADENRLFDSMEPLWFFPNNGLGSASNGCRTAVPSVEVDGNKATIYLYAADNGYASYTFTVGGASTTSFVDNAMKRISGKNRQMASANTGVVWSEKAYDLQPYEKQTTLVTAERLQELGVTDYVYAYVEATSEAIAYAELIDPCLTAEVVDWRGPINIPETTGKWYKVDVAEALASGKDIEMTVTNGPVDNDVVMKMSTECFDPASALATTTVKAIVPADWTDQIYVWVWPTGGAGTEYPATKEGDFWTYTHNGDDVNIIFKNGQGWQGLYYQTEDMTFSEDACIQLTADVYGGKATYSVVNCSDGQITVKAQVPADWTDQIYVWVWPTGGTGTEYLATKEGDFWTYTHTGDYVNIIFKNGQGWQGAKFQTEDMTFSEDACIELIPNGEYNKAIYQVVDCGNSNTSVGSKYTETRTSYYANEVRKTIITQDRLAELNINDYVYVYVETTGSMTITATTVEDTPCVYELNYYAEFCEYFDFFGVRYTKEGTYNQEITLSDGCLYNVTLYLTENCAPVEECDTVHTEFDAQFCDKPYNWNGQLYDVEGDHVQILKKTDGCDSIVTMHLTKVCEPIPSCEDVYTEFKTTFCGTFVWNKQEYTEAGDYTQILSKTDGCDSIVTLHLTEECVTPPTPEIPGNPCLDAIPFDWTTGAFLGAGEAQWYEMDITSLIENKQHLMLTFINHSDENAWINVAVALDCEGRIVPMMLPVLANMNVDQTIDYQILKRSPLKRIYVGVYTKEADIELKSAVRSAIATDQTPCLNATEVQYNETYVHEPGTSWYKVSVDLLKNNSDALGFYFANKGNKHAHVTVGMVADCQYTTGTTITLPIPTGLDFNVLAPNLLKVLMQEVESFEEKLNDWDVQEIYVKLTSDQTIEFALKEKDGNYDCESAIDFDWADWEANGIQLQADQDVWYRMNMEYPIEKLLREEEMVIAITNFDSVAIDVEMTVSPTCPVVVSVDKSFSVPARTAVKKTLSYADAMQWLARHDEYLPYEQIKLFVDKYGDHLSYAELKDMLKNFKKYISVEQLKQELAKHTDYIGYENVEAALNKYGKFIPYVDAEALLKKFEDELVIAAGYAVIVLQKCEPYITAENFWQLVEKCKPYIPFEELKQLLEIVEKHLEDYTCYLHVKTTGDLYVGPKPLPIPCDDVLVEDTVEACGQYEWKGVLYTESGDYSYTQPLADPTEAEFLDWKQPIKLSEFTKPWYKVDVTEVFATQTDFTLLIENDLNEAQEVNLALHDAMAEFLLSGTWNVATGVHPKTVTFEKFEQIVDPEHKVLYLHNMNYDCERTEVLHLTIVDCNETITAAVCDGSVYVDPITNVEHLISSLVPSTLTWTETVLSANKEKTVYTYVITPVVAPAGLTAEVLATIPGATPVLTPGLMPNITGTAEAIKAYYESIDTDSVSDVVSVSWETAAVACGATSHTMTLVVEDDCDNVVKAEITLEVATVEPVEETVTACDSYEWNGTTYTTSGDYTYTTTNANGCDSVVILHLTINQSETVEETVTACDSYEWHGQTYTASGDYTFTTVAANGCDRIEILHLTINKSETVEETITACDSYVWNGQTYTESGTYTYTTVAANGCDRIETLYLTINKSVVGEPLVVEICPGDSYSWEGEDYDQAGTYTITLTNAMGCDSIATLVLSIPDPENSADHAEIAAVSKYGGRLLVLDLNTITATLGFTPAPDDVKWYKLVGEMDAPIDALDPVAGDDECIDTGYYYENSGEKVAGQYYALFEQYVETLGCNAIYRSVVLSAANAAKLPMLAPNVVGAEEDVRVLNLNSSTENAIRVYNMTGDLMATFKASYVDEFAFKAASFSGYYMVEIENAYEKVTLRYIVK